MIFGINKQSSQSRTGMISRLYRTILDTQQHHSLWTSTDTSQSRWKGTVRAVWRVLFRVFPACGKVTVRLRLVLASNFLGANPAQNLQIKQKTTLFSVVFMVDDTRLELVTSRTSSGCATSCANERCALWGLDFARIYCSYSHLPQSQQSGFACCKTV